MPAGVLLQTQKATEDLGKCILENKKQIIKINKFSITVFALLKRYLGEKFTLFEAWQLLNQRDLKINGKYVESLDERIKVTDKGNVFTIEDENFEIVF